MPPGRPVAAPHSSDAPARSAAAAAIATSVISFEDPLWNARTAIAAGVPPRRDEPSSVEYSSDLLWRAVKGGEEDGGDDQRVGEAPRPNGSDVLHPLLTQFSRRPNRPRFWPLGNAFRGFVPPVASDVGARERH
jgi:hypothetical protein